MTPEDGNSGERVTFSARFACPVSGFTIAEIEPRLFSFNNPFGACPACDGLGTKLYFDPDLVVPDDAKSLREGAVAPWANSTSQYYHQTLESLARHLKVSMRYAVRDLPEAARHAVLFGTGSEPVTMQYDDGLRSYRTNKPFEGVLPNMERRYRETDSAWVREGSRAASTTPARARPATATASSPRRWRSRSTASTSPKCRAFPSPRRSTGSSAWKRC